MTIDWGSNKHFDFSGNFYGRSEEINRLEDLVIEKKYKLINLYGIRGIGKNTTLSHFVKYIENEFDENEFDFIIWRSFESPLSIEDLVKDCIKLFFNQTDKEIGKSSEVQINKLLDKLLDYLDKFRCLIILENFESIIDNSNEEYLPKYADYKTLLHKIGKSNHNSCLLISSNQKLQHIELLTDKVSSERLLGLDIESCKSLMQDKKLEASDDDIRRLAERYSFHPHILKIITSRIQESYSGNVSEFLSDSSSTTPNIDELTRNFIQELSLEEKLVIYWLAINQEPISSEALEHDIISIGKSIDIESNLNKLERKSLITKNNETRCYSISNLIKYYVIKEFINNIIEELISKEFRYFDSHLIYKATAKEYVKALQENLILVPLIERLENKKINWDECLKSFKKNQENVAGKSKNLDGYAAGNIINLLLSLKSEKEISLYDFSHLTIRQVYFKNRILHNVNFSHSEFIDCEFNQSFGSVMSIAFSPNGKYLAIADNNGNIHISEFTKYRTKILEMREIHCV